MWGVLGVNKAFFRGILGDHIENTLVNYIIELVHDLKIVLSEVML